MKSKFYFFLIALFCNANYFAQGIGNSKTTQNLPFPDSNEVSSGKSRIYVLRTSGTLWNYSVSTYINNEIVGKLGPKSYIMFEVEANKPIKLDNAFDGNHVRRENNENKDYININPKEGKIYYIEVKAKYGSYGGRTISGQLDSEKALKLLSKYDKPKVNYIE